MSKKIDERVVEMRFDNKDFEENVSTSMSTLEKLKKSLKFDDTSKNFSSISKAAKSVDMSSLSKSVDNIRLKFSALQVTAVTALANIANSAVDAGKRISSAFTLDPIISGFNEYETQINAVQTILANTQSKGSTLDDVNAALDELNTYADKTIYNFTEMTRNIGTFTAAGVDLDRAVTSIKGIANLAAASGSSSQQASTAMYQLSQAIAAGKVQLMDWNSVVNAGMGGELFQNALKRTAKHFGYNVDAMIEKYGSFRESLTKGEWLTTEVLTETLTQLSGAYTEADLIAQGYSESQAKEITQLAQTAVDAATKVKTYTQLMDTLKEAAQSGWTQTWEIIIGDFEEAKELFSGISDFLGDIINQSSQRRNDLLEGALGGTGSKWETLTAKMEECGVSAGQFEERLRDTAIASGMTGEAFDAIIQKEGSLANAFKNGQLSVGLIKDTIKSFVDNMSTASKTTEVTTDKLEYFNDVVRRVIRGDFSVGAERIQALTDAGYDHVAVQKLVNKVWERNGKNWSDVTVTAEELSSVINNLSSEELVSIGYTQEQADALKELAKQAEETGTPINQLIENLNKPFGRELLIDSFKNIFKSIYDGIQAVRNAWTTIFPPITSGQLYGVIELFHGLTEGLLLTEETANNIQRTFQGLFAILDLVATVAGGGLRIAFTIISEVLSAFGTDILSVTAKIGDAVVQFRNWIKENSLLRNAIQVIVPMIKDIVEAIGSWIQNNQIIQNGINSLTSLLGSAKTSIEQWVNGLKETDNIPEYIISGLVNGLRVGISKVAEVMFEIGTSILNAIKSVLGIHSPSTEFFEIGKNTIQGFIDGVQDGISSLLELFAGIGEKCLEIIRNIDFGKVFAVGIGAGIIYTAKRVLDLIDMFAAPAKGIGHMTNSIGKFFDAITENIKPNKWNTISKTVMEFAIAIGILAASVYVLAQLETGNLWSAVGAIGALAAIITIMSIAISKLKLSGDGFGKLSLFIVGLSASLYLMGSAIKKLEFLNTENIVPVLGGFFAMIAGIMAIVLALSKLVENSNPATIAQAGGTVLGISAALLLMATTIKIISGFNAGDIGKGIICMTLFGGLITGLIAATKLAGKNIVGVGTTIMGIAGAMLLLVGVIKIVSGMKPSEILKGMVCLALFESMIIRLVVITGLFGKNTAGIGGTILAVSAAMLLMAGVMRIVAGMEPEGLAKGIICITALGVIITGLIAATRLAGGNNLKGVSATLLTMSLSIGILAGIAIVLSLIDLASLAKGITAVGILSAMMALMIHATKGAQDCKGNIIAMTIAIGLMTAAIVALSFIDLASLTKAVAALSVVMGMFALVEAMAGRATGAMGAIIAMTVAIGMLSAALYILSGIPAESLISTAASLSMLLLSLSVSIALLNGMNSVSASAIGSMALLGLILAEIGIVLGVMSHFNVTPSIETATSLSILLMSMAGVLAVLTLIGVGGPAAFIGIGAFATLIASLGIIMAGLGALVTYIPSMQTWLTTGIAVLEQIGQGLGSFLGSIANGFFVSATASLPQIGSNLSGFITNVQGFVDGAKGIDSSATEGIKNIAAAMLTITGSGFLESITSWLTGSSSFDGLSEKMTALGEGIKAYCDSVNGLDTSGLEASTAAGKAIIEMANSIPNSGGLLGGIVGNNDADTFGSKLKGFGEGIKEYCDAVNGIETSGLDASIQAATAIIGVSKEIENSGGFISKIVGDNDIGTFGGKLKGFGEGIKNYCDAVNGIETSGLDASIQAATAIIGVSKEIENSGGFISKIVGDNDIGKFGSKLGEFGSGIKAYCDAVNGINMKGVPQSLIVASIIVDIANKIPETGGVNGLLDGNIDLADFAESLKSLGTGIKDFCGEVNNIGSTEGAISALSILTTLQGTSLSSIDPSQMSSVGESLSKLGGQIKEFVDSVSNVDSTSTSNIQTTVESITTAVSGLSDINLEGFVTAFEGASTRVSTAATNMGTAVTNSINTMNGTLSTAGSTLMTSFADGISQSTSAVTSNAMAVLTSVTSTISEQSGTFAMLGNSLMTSFGQGMAQAGSYVSAAAASVAQSGANGAKSAETSFYSTGKYIAMGLARGITAGKSSVIQAAIEIARAADTAARDTLGVESPSRAFMAIGRYIGEGLAIGIRDNAYRAVNETTDMAQKIQNAASMAFEDVESWVSDAKAFDELTTADEFVLWDTLTQKYEEGTEERLKAEKNAYTAYKALLSEKFQNSKDWIDREKEYNRLSLEEELAAWEEIQATYIEGTEEREEADKQVYKLRHELIDGSIDLLEQEIARQEELLARLEEGSEEYINTQKEIDYLRSKRSNADLANSERWIQEQQDYDRFTMASELAAYLRIANKARNGFYGEQSDEILEEYEKKIYDSQKGIYERYQQYQKDCAEVQEEGNKKRLELQEEYAEKEKEINEQLKEDIKELNDEYDNELKSRADTLYKSYNLFDEVSEKEEINASDLMKNLQDQVSEFDEWRDAMDSLSARGLNEDLIDELQEMGPSAIAEIKALNSMSDSQLAEYVTLWATRHQEATDRAEEELEDMRISTSKQIEALEEQAKQDLEDYKDIWFEKMRELDESVDRDLRDLRQSFGEEVGLIKKDTTAETQNMVNEVRQIMLEAGWSEIGEQIVNGLTEGVMSAAPTFVDALSGTVISGQGELIHGWDEHSPSKVAAGIGKNIVLGLAVGVKDEEDSFYTSLGDLTDNSIDALSDTISSISDVIGGDMDFEPSIRPVVDMTNIDRSLGYMDGVISARRSVALGMSISQQNQNREYSVADRLISNLADINSKSNGEIVDAIVSLKSDFDNLASRIEQLQIVMDTGTLVGAISPQMDKSLGKMAAMSRRRTI